MVKTIVYITGRNLFVALEGKKSGCREADKNWLDHANHNKNKEKYEIFKQSTNKCADNWDLFADQIKVKYIKLYLP